MIPRYLYSDFVMYCNLSYYDESGTDEEWEAAVLADCAQFIKSYNLKTTPLEAYALLVTLNGDNQ